MLINFWQKIAIISTTAPDGFCHFFRRLLHNYEREDRKDRLELERKVFITELFYLKVVKGLKQMEIR